MDGSVCVAGPGPQAVRFGLGGETAASWRVGDGFAAPRRPRAAKGDSEGYSEMTPERSPRREMPAQIDGAGASGFSLALRFPVAHGS